MDCKGVEILNKKEKTLREIATYRRYTKPNSNQRPHFNAIYLRKGNTLDHEMEKVRVAWEHIQNGCKIITEAQIVDDNDRIVDLVCLNPECPESGEIEIVNTSLSELSKGEVRYV